MNSQWDETCLVCCEKTKNRCSKCVEAGIDLFFCSAQCQRLVWSIHKLVCGPGKANPFVWPLLSKDESRDIIDHMHETTGYLIDREPDVNTVAKALQRYAQVPPGEESNLTVGGPPVIAGHGTQQVVLAIIRATEYARVAPSSQTLDGDGGFPSSIPMGSASEWDVFQAHDEAVPVAIHGAEPWRAQMRHYVLVYRFTNYVGWPTRREDLAAQCFQQRLRIADFIRTTVAASSPRLAKKLITRMDEDAELAIEQLLVRWSS